MTRIFYVFAVMALASPVWADCRTTHGITGRTWTTCDNGYKAEEQSGVTSNTFGRDNEGHTWQKYRSPVIGGVFTKEQ